MLTFLAFVVAIGILVAVHEYGHFAMARACGVKVLRFSVGFGPRLMGWTSSVSGTEYRVGAVPIGGYVKMLDEREGPVAPDERAFAFNTQPLRNKAAIVVAGPLANLLLAIVLYAGVNWMGVEQPQAILAKPPQESVVARAGFVGGERVARAAFESDELHKVVSFDDLRWWLTRGAIERRNVQLEFFASDGGPARLALLPLAEVDAHYADARLFRQIGVMGPLAAARVGAISSGSAAMEADLHDGDLVLRVDDTAIADAAQLRELIRISGQSGVPQAQNWLVDRNGSRLALAVAPRLEKDGDVSIGRVGAMIGARPAFALVRYGWVDGATQAVARTWEVSMLTLRMMGQMVTGDASLKNLSGPITIADYAGKSASIGVTPFLVFLALMSISLGVLNLLPVPVLDGGHLMYYLWESLSGRPVSSLWTERLQKVGLLVLLMMMSVAVFNDLARLLG